MKQAARQRKKYGKNDNKFVKIKIITQKMNSFAKLGNAEECENLFISLLNDHLQPTAITVNVLLKSYCVLSYKLFELYGNQLNLSDPMLKSLTVLRHMKHNIPLNAYLPSKQTYFTSCFGQILTSVKQIYANEGSYNIVCSYLAQQGLFNYSLTLLFSIEEQGFNTNKSLSSIIKESSFEEAVTLARDLLGVDNMASYITKLKLDITAINTLLSVLSLELSTRKALVTDLTERIVDHAIAKLQLKLNSRSLSIIFSIFAANADVIKAEKFFLAALKSHTFKVDIILLTSYLNCVVMSANFDIEKAENIVAFIEGDTTIEYKADSILNTIAKTKSQLKKPDIVLYNLLLKGFSRQSPPNYTKAKGLLEKIYRRRLVPTLTTLSLIVRCFCSVGLPKEAELIVQEVFTRTPSLKKHKNESIFNVLIQGYARCRCTILNDSCACKVCFCSNPNEALRLVKEMELAGLSPKETTLNSVVESLCSSKRFEHAINVVNDVMFGSKVPPTLKTFAILVRGVLRATRDATCTLNDSDILNLKSHKMKDKAEIEVLVKVMSLVLSNVKHFTNEMNDDFLQLLQAAQEDLDEDNESK